MTQTARRPLSCRGSGRVLTGFAMCKPMVGPRSASDGPGSRPPTGWSRSRRRRRSSRPMNDATISPARWCAWSSAACLVGAMTVPTRRAARPLSNCRRLRSGRAHAPEAAITEQRSCGQATTLITRVRFASSTAAKYSSKAALRRCLGCPDAALACSTPVGDNPARGSGRRGRRFKSCHPDCIPASEALTRVGEGLSCCQYRSKIPQVPQQIRTLTFSSNGLPHPAQRFARDEEAAGPSG